LRRWAAALGVRLIAPLPYHGLADRMTEAHARLRAEDLVRYADEVVDIPRGLGDRLTLAGHSAGGPVTAWAAQQRADIDQAVLISPGFGFEAVPQALTPAGVRAYQILPNSFMSWDPSQQERTQPYHSCPRISTRALAEILRLSLATQALARQQAPGARSILVIINGNDQQIDNDATAAVVATWRDHGASVATFEFPAGLRLDHDLIDAQNPNQNVAAVYPRLIELIDQ
jgi:carboxylesterase